MGGGDYLITIQNGKLNIPDEDRFVGFAGDNTVNEKQIVLKNRADDDCDYTLCLRFDDGTVKTAALSASISDGDTVLIWQVRDEQIHSTGVVTAQLKIADSDDNIEHTTKDFFLVGSSVELSDDGAEEEYVTPSMLRNSINQALSTIASTAPYVGDDGFWYVYDPDEGAYVKTEYYIGGLTMDSAMSDSSLNPVSNKFIKQYVDALGLSCNTFARDYTDLEVADKVSETRKIANIPLSADITSAALVNALLPYTCVSNVVPGSSGGIKGQTGTGSNGEPFFCISQNTWVRLASISEVNQKMDLAEEVDPSDVDDVDEGSLYLCGGNVYLKNEIGATELAKAASVYTKAEINTMIGDIETLLAAV